MTLRMIRTFLAAIFLVSVMIVPVLPGAIAPTSSAAQGDSVLITFEPSEGILFDPQDIDAVTLSDHYADLGITFNNPVVVSYRDLNPLPDYIQSGYQALHLCESTQIVCDHPLTMTFSAPQRHAGVWVGLSELPPAPVEVTMTAYDAEIGGTPFPPSQVMLDPAVGGESIPAQPLEIAIETADIRRVEISVPSDSLMASALVFDDVSFGTDNILPSVGGEGDPTCEPGTADPAIRLQQPKSKLVVYENVLTLQAQVKTTQDLTEAILTTESGGFTRQQPLSPSPLTGKGVALGPVSVENFLFVGENTLTLSVSNCHGSASFRRLVTYEPTSSDARYAMQAMEVTQTIQDLTNSVRLVAGKRTFVRVFLTTSGGTDTLTNVSGTLRACRVAPLDPNRCQADEPELPSQHSLYGVAVDSLSSLDNLVAKREKMRFGLLFEAPPEWTKAGTVHIWLDSDSLSPKLPCDGCANTGADDEWISFDFVAGSSFTVDVVNVPYEEKEVTYRPTADDQSYLLSWLKRTYPTNNVREVSELSVGAFAGEPTCDLVNQALFAEWVVKTYGDEPPADVSSVVTPTRYYGMVAARDHDDEHYMPGCALSGTKQTTDQRLDYEHFASGPAGSGVASPWDLDGSYADWYGGHEIAHTFDRQHVATCNNSQDEDKEYPGESGRISVKADPDRIDYIGFDTGYPIYNLPVRVYRADKWHDVMTYCSYQWMSAYTYNALWDVIKTEEEDQTTRNNVSRVMTNEFQPVNDVDGIAADEGDFGDTPSTTDEVVLVLGTVNLDNDTVVLRPSAVLPGDVVTQRDESGEYRIVLRDKNETLLATYVFQPLLYTDRPVGADRLAQLSEIVPWNDDTAFIDIYKENVVPRLDRQEVSDHDPWVDIVAPNGGEQLQGDVVTVSWTAGDENGDSLTYSLHSSTDGGVTWRSLASGLRDTSFDVDLRRIPESDQALFRVVASDGVRTAADRSDAYFHVPPHAPDVSIISPAEGTRYGTSHTIVLVGEATDIDQGRLDDSALVWTVTEDGTTSRPLGVGSSISVPDLPPGRHTITLTAKGAGHLTATKSITIRVTDDEPPVLDWAVSGGSSGNGFTSGTLGAEGLFLYDNTDEAGTFFAGDGAGQLQPLRTFDVLLNGWSSVIPGNFGGDAATDLLFYASDLGVGEFYASDGAGGMSLLSGNEGFTKGWDLIVPVELHPDDEWTSLLFYDRAEGVGKLYTTDGSGRIQLLGAPVALGHSWSSIVAGQFGDDDLANLLLYDQATGQVQRFTIDDQGVFAPQEELPGWNVGWDAIVPGHFGGAAERTDLFLYDAETGNATVVLADETGNLTQSDRDVPIPGRWSSLVGGRFHASSTFTDLFFYDAVQGLAAFYTMNDQGEFQELESMSDLTPGWDQIVPGYFGTP